MLKAGRHCNVVALMGSVLLDAVSDAVSFYLIVSDIAMSPKTVWSATAVHFY